MSDTVITQDGINAVHFTYGSGSLFALKYFMPIYDHRIDPNIHNTPPSDLDPLSTYELSATVSVSATHGNNYGERIYNLDGNSISDSGYFLYREAGEGTLTMNGTSALLAGISQTKPTQTNLFNNKALAFTDSTEVEVISGSNISGSNGTFTISDYGIVPRFDENSLGELSNRLFKVHSYAPSIGGTVSADRGQYTAVLDASVGNFKFNKVAFYVQKVNPDFTDYIGSNPILFCVTPISSVAIKTSGATNEPGAYGNIGVDGMSRIDHVLEIEFSTSQTVSNTSYQIVDYWTALPAVYGPGVHHMGDVVIGTSGVPGSYDPLAHVTSYDSEKAQLALAYNTAFATLFTTTSAGYLDISTSGDTPFLHYGTDNILSGLDSIIIGTSNTVSGDGSFAYGNTNTINTRQSIAFGNNNNIVTNINNLNSINGEEDNYTFGNNNTLANGSYKFAVGQNHSLRDSDYQFAFGANNSIFGEYSFAVGSGNSAYSNYASVFGSGNNIVESASTNISIFGQINTAIGIITTAFTAGLSNTVGKDGFGITSPVAIGFNNTSEATAALALGHTCTASAESSIAIGKLNRTFLNAVASMATGLNNEIYEEASFTVGWNNVVYSKYSFAGGQGVTIGEITDIGTTATNTTFAFGNNLNVVGIGNTIFGIDNVITDITSKYNLLIGDTNKIDNGDYNIVGGRNNQVELNNNIIGGSGNNVYGLSSLVVGTNISAISISHSLVGGFQTSADGTGILICGTDSYYYGDNGMSVGLELSVSGDNHFVAGKYNNVYGDNHFAFGNNNLVAGIGNFVGGRNNFLSDSEENTVFGSYNRLIRTTSADDLPVGNFVAGTENRVYTSIASAVFGYLNEVTANYNLVFGKNNVSVADSSIVGGTGSNIGLNGTNSVAIGENAIASRNASQAFGKNTIAYGENSFAGGNSTKASSPSSFMFGSNVQEGPLQLVSPNVGMGSDIEFKHPDGDNDSLGGSVALGKSLLSQGAYSFTAGYNSNNYGNYDISIGTSNNTGDVSSPGASSYNIAIGYNNTARAIGGINSVAIGEYCRSYGPNAHAYGLNNVVQSDANLSMVFGNNFNVYGTNVFAFGHSATINATVTNSMVFNLDSTTNPDNLRTNRFVFNTPNPGDYAMIIKNSGVSNSVSHGLVVEVPRRVISTLPGGAFEVHVADGVGNDHNPMGVTTNGNIYHDGDRNNGYKTVTGKVQWTVSGNAVDSQLNTDGTNIDTGIPTSNNIPKDFSALLKQNPAYFNFNGSFTDNVPTVLYNTFKLTDASGLHATETWVTHSSEFVDGRIDKIDVADAEYNTYLQGNYHTFNAQLCKLKDGTTGLDLPNWYIVVSNVTGHFMRNAIQHCNWSFTYKSIS